MGLIVERVHNGVEQKKDFSQAPFIAIWEVTRACQLHCLHCRAQAQRYRDPRELSTAEGLDLIDQIADMGTSLIVFTGGDPLEREDLFSFITHAKSRGLDVGISPSATPKVTKDAILQAKEAGLSRWAFSLDGSTAQIHDHFRGTKGSFDLTMRALHILKEEGIPIQLNSTLSRFNLHDLPAIADIAESFGTTLWSVFSLIPTGRARVRDMISAEEHEQTMEWLYEQSLVRSFIIKTTESPEYRRVVLQHNVFEFRGAVNDGDGFVFISHIGDVAPSGFLPITVGNIRDETLEHIYRDTPVFQALRDRARLVGKCNVCSFRDVCGGSRARAYALTGNYLESDPLCTYIPEHSMVMKGELQP
ncbi:radical SAM additional 4Fe4S-binding SPASM domain-containing protein [Alicyclobacillus hesperidum]|uniref:Radical SAM additional 4Fe4S-binding SPASM domain-containing protein n=1 Tax=Alicyclobacillus hesperidum TaxID=89784 RepID=A0A1H2Y6W4_9BACL|nr:radical SAM protein [Alicyclobacillus hesperidum]SDX00942.1 radical SAM additional 4Fe4S-binding SPASM domain-containing protein [Alicyclobacillus hesperidum]